MEMYESLFISSRHFYGNLDGTENFKHNENQVKKLIDCDNRVYS